MPGWTSAIIMLVGPIKHWWDANWGTPAHHQYIEWRDRVSTALVDAGYLVYHPHKAFKGAWDERAQAVNDQALEIADLILNLTPPGIPSEGTDGEILKARDFGTTILPAPPTLDYDTGIAELIEQLAELGLQRPAIMQAKVIESVSCSPDRAWHTRPVLTALLATFAGHIFRLHYVDPGGRNQATDTHTINLGAGPTQSLLATLVDGTLLECPLSQLRKVEVLG